MLKASEIERASMAFDKPLRDLEMQIMEDIVRRIKINGEITRSADWQIYRLHELGMSKREIKKAIADNLDLSKAEIKHLFKDILRKGYEWDDSIYKTKGKARIPLEENEGLQRLLSAVSEQTSGELKNISQSLGFAVKQPDGKLKFTQAADFYQQSLDNAIMGIASGAFDYNTVIKKVISDMTNSGLRTVDYATGWSNRADVAARRSVMTGLSQLTAKMNEDNAKELGTDYFEVTWHSGARPSHQEWQGKVYSRKELETICGLGTVTGLCGANCYHDYYPFIPGISERSYTDEELAQMNAEENKPVKYGDKEYTKYEALQRQRKLETAMRAQRQKIHLLEEAGTDEEDIINARCRYRGTSQEYTRFSKAMGLPQQRERVTADGLGNIGVGKYSKAVDKNEKYGIMNVGSDDVALEYQRYGRNKNTLVNSTYIESGEYRRKFDNATDNAEVNKALYDNAKKALRYRSGIAFEDMYWIDSNTGKTILAVEDSKEERAIIYNERIMKTIRNESDIITLHTHPSSMPPSASDLNSCFRNGYKKGFVACHNGRVFGYTANEEINERIYNMYVERFTKDGYDEFGAQMRALNKLSQTYDVSVWEVLHNE